MQMRMKDFLLDDTNAASDMSLTCDSAIGNMSKEKCCPNELRRTLPTDEDCEKRNFRCDEQLLKFKAFFFLFFAGFGATFPYLGVYFKQIGLNASYVGVLAGIRPLIQFISGPFWALIADKYKARKVILLFSILAWLVMTLMLALPRPHKEVCRLNNSTRSKKTKPKSGVESQRSIIPYPRYYPGDFQGRFGFNFVYPTRCTRCSTSIDPKTNIQKRDLIQEETSVKRYRRFSENSSEVLNIRNNAVNERERLHPGKSLELIHERHFSGQERDRRNSGNSSELVLSLEYEDKHQPFWEHDSREPYEGYWKRGHTAREPNTDTDDGDGEKPVVAYVIERNDGEVRELFYIFLSLIVLGEFLEAPSFIMIDTALLDHLGNEKKHYGKTRLFGSVGYGVASFSVGALLDRFQYTFCGKTLTNYLVIFYIFACAMVIAFIFGLCFVKFKYHDTKEESKPIDCVRVFYSVKYGSFLTICWFCGFCHGGIMNFLNWYLEDLGASKLMMGVATSCRCSAIIFGFFTSSYFIDRIGHIALICWALASYVGSFFGYSLLHNPWWAIPIEVVQGLIYAISWSSCINYLGDIAPPNTAATMQGILQGVYWGLGTGSGTIAGGFLINHIGVRTAFRVGGSVGAVVFVLFVALQYWIARKERCSKTSHES